MPGSSNTLKFLCIYYSMTPLLGTNICVYHLLLPHKLAQTQQLKTTTTYISVTIAFVPALIHFMHELLQ